VRRWLWVARDGGDARGRAGGPHGRAGEAVDLGAELEQLRSEGPVPALGIVVRDPSDLDRALEALRDFKPDPLPE
jgi:hypothetical protein